MSTSTPDLRFPDERPLRSDELEQLDARRLEPVIQTLTEGLKSYWGRTGRPESDLARVWGVHGALGQGKSTVVNVALHRIEHTAEGAVRPRVHIWNWIRLFTQRHAPRRKLLVTTLEASQLKAEHLNTTLFSRLVLPRLVLWALPMSVLTTLLPFVALLVLSRSLGQEDWLFETTEVVIAMLVAILALPVIAILKAWGQAEYSYGYMEQAIYRLARWTGVAPDLVVLDDLDRATVEQQRAVLRTLVRHTRLLQCPLVVCFDETDFLASDPNPEDPAELLRKLIQVPLRLPPRSREDAVLLAWGSAKVWLQHNPGRQTWATFLRHPVWIGHLTRVMLLTESVGPRRAKGLLADVIAAAETHYPLQHHRQVPLAEANALLLLSALYQMHPALRRDAEWLVNCLESGGDDDAWKRWSETPRCKAFFKWISTHPREEAQIRSLLRLADAMMPMAKGWRGIVFGGNVLTSGQALPEDGLAVGCYWLDRMLQQDLAAYPRWIEAGRALDRIAQGIRGTEGLSTVVSSWRLSDADGTTHRDTPQAHAHETDTPVFAAIWPMLIASLAQWPEHQRLQVYSAVSRWLQREARHTRTLQQHWLLEWAMDRTHAGSGSDEFWLKQIEPGGTDGPTDPTSVIRLATLKALRRHRKPSQRFGQQSWRVALGLADSAGLAVDPGLMAAAITQNGEIPPHRTTDGSRSNSAALRYWPAVQAPAGTEPSPPVMQEVLGEHMRAARTWLTGSATPLGGLAAERDADGGPRSLIQWMASHDAEQLHLQHWLKALAPLCAPSPDPLPSEWSFAHWSAHFVYHAPTAMGSDKLGEQRAAIEELDSEGWAVALCLLTQGWHRELTDLHRLQLGQALIGCMPPSPTVPFALGALSAWLPPADMLKAPSSSEHQIEHVYFQALPMVPEDAIKLIKWLLGAINPGDGGGPDGTDGITTSKVTQFFQSWAQVKPPEALNFYRLAKEHWDLRIQDSSGGNLSHRDDQYGSPDNLF